MLGEHIATELDTIMARSLKLSLGLSAILAALTSVRAETHTITFDNRCGYGTVGIEYVATPLID